MAEKKPFFQRLKAKAHEIKKETYTLALAYRHPETPWYAKVFAAVVVAYAFSPIDLVPDFIPILGYLDDILLVPLGIKLALKMIPEEVLADARKRAELEFKDGKPKNWVVGTIIVLIWLVILTWVVLKAVRWIRGLSAG